MMLVSAVALFCLHTLFVISVFYQLMVENVMPIMASLKILAIAYGIYAVAKIILLVRKMFKGGSESLYSKILL